MSVNNLMAVDEPREPVTNMDVNITFSPIDNIMNSEQVREATASRDEAAGLLEALQQFKKGVLKEIDWEVFDDMPTISKAIEIVRNSLDSRSKHRAALITEKVDAYQRRQIR